MSDVTNISQDYSSCAPIVTLATLSHLPCCETEGLCGHNTLYPSDTGGHLRLCIGLLGLLTEPARGPGDPALAGIGITGTHSYS